MSQLPALGGVTDIVDSEYTGFVYAPRKAVIPLLGNDSAADHSTLQEPAKGYREARFRFTATSSAEKDAVLAYDESSAIVAFVDYDGLTRDVIVLAAAPTHRGVDLWDIATVLQERSAPVPLGS